METLTLLGSKRGCDFLETATVYWDLFHLLTGGVPPLPWLSIALELVTFINTDLFPNSSTISTGVSGRFLSVFKSGGKQLSLSPAKPPQPCHQLGPRFIPAPSPCCTVKRPSDNIILTSIQSFPFRDSLFMDPWKLPRRPLNSDSSGILF